MSDGRYITLEKINSKEDAIMVWLTYYGRHHQNTDGIRGWLKKSGHDNFFDQLVEEYKITYDELAGTFEMIKIFQ